MGTLTIHAAQMRKLEGTQIVDEVFIQLVMKVCLTLKESAAKRYAKYTLNTDRTGEIIDHFFEVILLSLDDFMEIFELMQSHCPSVPLASLGTLNNR